MFITYKANVENQLNKNIKILKSNRDGEYESNEFSKFCANFGIIHQTTAPYTPQQNRIVERKNRTLKEMVNFMLVSSGSPQNLRGESLLTANQGTPQETWSYSIWVVALKASFLLLPQNVGVPCKSANTTT